MQELYTLKVERKGCGTGRKKKKKNPDMLPYEQQGTENSSSSSPAEATSPKKAGGNVGKVKPGKFVKPKEEVRDRSGAVVEEGEALFQGFRVTKDDQKRLQALYRVIGLLH